MGSVISCHLTLLLTERSSKPGFPLCFGELQAHYSTILHPPLLARPQRGKRALDRAARFCLRLPLQCLQCLRRSRAFRRGEAIAKLRLSNDAARFGDWSVCYY